MRTPEYYQALAKIYRQRTKATSKNTSEMKEENNKVEQLEVTGPFGSSEITTDLGEIICYGTFDTDPITGVDLFIAKAYYLVASKPGFFEISDLTLKGPLKDMALLMSQLYEEIRVLTNNFDKILLVHKEKTKPFIHPTISFIDEDGDTFRPYTIEGQNRNGRLYRYPSNDNPYRNVRFEPINVGNRIGAWGLYFDQNSDRAHTPGYYRRISNDRIVDSAGNRYTIIDSNPLAMNTTLLDSIRGILVNVSWELFEN